MKGKGILVTGLALSIFATGCGNVNEYGAERGVNHQRDAFNVNYENKVRHEPGFRNNNKVTPRRVNDTRAERLQVNDSRAERLQVSDEIADKVSELKEVKNSHVMLTDKTAYVAAVLEGNKNHELSNEIKEKISKQVRKADPSVKNVHVSVNPEFVNRMEGYTTHVREGHPISGIFDEFTETVRRIFPTNR
ncbi:YhcN/YlaJ family sporulation lipoprotein [Sutcliffiella rhizosphaerae]|uniref:Spore germination lipoprotein YhcN n=1 Tax=Sutcliffiella rhizosphaerae TaxID=2880967 RepID=A0ABN8AEK0_9BACI|nr:YhcN/YlaJ family sporulation lipoprotein [Sutcliffiella rhizosphaerae]CAG9623700.1 putative spore germination lipoprotein YhcN [Sutcliffiella rhizosphaerae]